MSLTKNIVKELKNKKVGLKKQKSGVETNKNNNNVYKICYNKTKK